MNTIRNTVLAAAAVGLTLTAAASGANADDAAPANSYTWGEFMGYTDPGMARGNVESRAACDCHGHKIRHWVGDDGHRRFQVAYAGAVPDNSVYITYRFDGFGYARVTQRMFATDGEGYVVPFGR